MVAAYRAERRGAVDGPQAAGYFLVTGQVTGDDLDGLPLVACN
jgi:hypothetical protein